MAYEAKNQNVQGRQLKVQELAIPFSITHNATPGSVVHTNDEPAVLFLRTEGNDKITTSSGALASGETATYSVAANDANGIVNFYVKLYDDNCSKVISAQVIDRVNGTVHPAKLGDTDGISSEGNIMITSDTTVDLSTTSLSGVLIVKYIVED